MVAQDELPPTLLANLGSRDAHTDFANLLALLDGLLLDRLTGLAHSPDARITVRALLRGLLG